VTTQCVKLVFVALALAAVTGCGSGSTPAPVARDAPATTHQQQRSGPTIKQQANSYLRIVAPVNAALEAWNAAYKDSLTLEERKAVNTPLIAATEKFDRDLLRVRWSPEVHSDVRALVNADAAFVGDLVADNEGSVDTSQAAHHEAAVGAAVAAVRGDLGLPDAK
jgi:hypothetical protein